MLQTQLRTPSQHFEQTNPLLVAQAEDASESLRNEITAGLYSRPENQNRPRLAHTPDGQPQQNEKRPENSGERTTTHSEHRKDFRQGTARHVGYTELVRDGVFIRKPLEGSVFERTKPVQFIVLHSTETRRVADAERVIDSWNNRGDNGKRVNPGTQFVVDRDGKIYTTASPDKATIHVNDSLTRRGVKNQNSVGIEIVHTGEQQYTYAQKMALTRLVSYLQDRYRIRDSKIVTHGQIQPATRTDPVGFDVSAFHRNRKQFRETAQVLEQQKLRSKGDV
ncbi:MAG: hypothetical protein C0469_16890 [Cyanobacteria bacterium DS2.3.42]|nr:hypothetical protein [Cyanobacteria bacterium DS2.3.42]